MDRLEINLFPALKKIAASTALIGSFLLNSANALAKDQDGFFNLPPSYASLFVSSAAGYIQSIQVFSITIPINATTNTATISSVNTSNTVILWNGWNGTSTTSMAISACYSTLTDATTVTATRNTSSGTETCICQGTVVEFTSAAVNVAAQYGAITIAAASASNTAAITSSNTARTPTFFLGWITSNASASTSGTCNVTLTNATTVTATRTGTSGTCDVSFCVIELTTTVVNSIQYRSVTLTSSTTSDTDTITGVTTANTMLLYNGVITSTSSPSNWFYYLSLTNTTTVTLNRLGISTSSRTIKYCVLEWKSGVIALRQEGNTDMLNVASNTTTITSVTTAKSAINMLGQATDRGTAVVDQLAARVTLTDATTVTANKVTSSNEATPGWEVIQFV